MVIVPLVVKLPDWDRNRSPPVMLMVPLLLLAPEPVLMVNGWLTLSRFWLSSWALRKRLPPVPTDAWMVARLVSVPLLTVSNAGWALLAFWLVRSIRPLLMKPLATVSVAPPMLPSPRMRMTELAVVLRVVIALSPLFGIASSRLSLT